MMTDPINRACSAANEAWCFAVPRIKLHYSKCGCSSNNTIVVSVNTCQEKIDELCGISPSVQIWLCSMKGSTVTELQILVYNEGMQILKEL